MKYRFLRFFTRAGFIAAFCAVVFAVPARAASSLSITEIMFDPAGSDDKREWVEVCNTGSSSIDMAGFFILTDGLSSSHHALAPQGSSVLLGGACTVIVQDVAGFKGDFPSYAGSIFDSSWTGLTATLGKTIVIMDGQSNVLDSVLYDPSIGGANTGDSLQKNSSGSWVAAAPTPGSADVAAVTSSQTVSADTAAQAAVSETQPSQETATISSGASSSKTVPSAQKMRIELSVPARAVVGMPVSISASIYGTSGEIRTFGGVHAAFGDGASADKETGKKFSHTYEYAGTYVVTLEYWENPFYAHDPDASARATLEVSEAGVSIASVTPRGDITIANGSSRDADLSGWIVAPLGKAFSEEAFNIPSGTVLLAGKSSTLPASVTGLDPTGSALLALMLPSGEVEWAPQEAEAPLAAVSSGVPASQEKGVAYIHAPAEQAMLPQAPGLPAAAVLAETNTAASAKKKHSIAPFLFSLLALIGAGAIALFKFGLLKKAETGEETTELSETEAFAEEIRIVEE